MAAARRRAWKEEGTGSREPHWKTAAGTMALAGGMEGKQGRETIESLGHLNKSCRLP